MEVTTQKRAVPSAGRPQPFSLRTPLLAEGSSTDLLAQTTHLWAHIKVYAQGGENALHCHREEDHLFVVLDGEATFYDEEEKPIALRRYQGMVLPKGTYYYFHSSGDTPLVMLRVGAGRNPFAPGAEDDRLGIDRRPLHGNSVTNKSGAQPGVPIPGCFFGD